MRNIDIAGAYIKDARIIYDESGESFKKGHLHRTVRKCQESVELALKGLLRLKGIEYPKTHKIGKILVESLKDEMDSDFLLKAADVSDQLALDRELSFYGSEEAPADKLFTEDEVKEIMVDVGFIINQVESIMRNLKAHGQEY